MFRRVVTGFASVTINARRYRWRFSLPGVLFIGLFFYMAWDTISDQNELLLLRICGTVLFFGLGILFLVLEWRNRRGIVFRLPFQRKDGDS